MRQLARAQMVPDAVDTSLDLLHWIQLRRNALSYPSDEYIRWYRAITWVYIGNPANHDTRSHAYQPTGVDRRMMEVDDMVLVVIREPPSSPSNMVVTISSRRSLCSRLVAVPGSTYPDRGARGVKKDAQRHPGRVAGGGHPLVPPVPERHEHVDPSHAVVEKGEGSGSGQLIGDPFDSLNLDVPSFSLGLTPASQSLPSGSGTSLMPPAPDLGFASFQSPHSTSCGFSGFRAPPPPGTAGSTTPHQPISQASSSDEEEREDDIDGVQHLGFGHRVS
ncbi:hypothetical protein M9H77_19419 [Catharanthus roseus]|uniref:Uncharacterized protein n=1 Tax=Catharanthus roseus TaxID=4058 RepID=A0ACC0BA94_CATRO|nr:hypothetical protein M9H77_19419 [Catharanthus roseus]